MSMKIGVAGAGHFGKFHLKAIKEIDELELSGFYDHDPEVSKQVSSDMGIRAFESFDQMLSEVDVVDVVVPTISHYDLARRAIKAYKHVFIEKPVTTTLDQAESLRKLAYEADVKIQVGHVERFNAAFMVAREYIARPLFIEIHRLAEFNPRSTDVSVVLNLMIHDIDAVLSVVNSGLKKVSASGASVVTDTPDISNARLEFNNGCVANITSSRISMKNMRKARFFQKDAYITVDFLKKETEVLKLRDTDRPDPLAPVIDLGGDKGMKEVKVIKPEISPNNAIREELYSFYQAIRENKTPVVSIDHGLEALNIAHQILDRMKEHENLV
jgi:predicted dehydrogenase